MINLVFDKACSTPSDINQHLPLLRSISQGVSHVTEFGVRGICSTWAWVASKVPQIHLYDIVHPRDFPISVPPYGWDTLMSIRSDIKFFQKSTLDCEIEYTDLLFIDTLHTGEQLYKELTLHHSKVKQWIIMHDTETYGHTGEIPNSTGLETAILPFLSQYPWRLFYRTPENNGLTILTRK